MLEKLRKFVTTILVLIVIAMGVVMWFQRRSHRSDLVKLHNEIALSTKTVEIHKNAFEKKAAELENFDSVLRTFEASGEHDAETIRRLRKKIEERDEEILATSRVAATWKKAYEAAVDATQSIDPGGDLDDPSDDRIRVDFEHDFGYIGVEGFTLTNPPHAWVSVSQNRPLLLTLTVTQAVDGHWTTYVTSSEDNVDLDIRLSGVNPYLFEEKWYEKFSLDFGVDVDSVGIFPYIGVSYPIGPVYLSGGVWGDGENERLGWYSTISYAWRPFSRR